MTTQSILTHWILAPPVIASVAGFDEALSINLGATSNQLSTNAGHTVEFVLKRADNVVFWIVMPYASNGAYLLTSGDDARLVNNTSYRVACIYQPSPTSTRYKAPSGSSNTISATPSNFPNAPSNVVASTVGTTTLDILVQWMRPSDFSEWSSTAYAIYVQLVASTGETISQVFNSQDLTQYTFTDLSPGKSYQASVQYSNVFGEGAPTSYGFNVTPTRVPDAPTLVSVSNDDMVTDLAWSAPAFNGQSVITAYKVYKDGTLLTTLSGSTFAYHATGLMNGYSYQFKVSAVNAIGESVKSSPLSALPLGQMSIVSVVASGKTLTATINPNGRPIESVLFVALDQDPNNVSDSDFVVPIPQQQISQVATSTITVVKTFSGFSSDIDFYCCIAHNSTNSAFYKSA